jgi:hypothetical protein
MPVEIVPTGGVDLILNQSVAPAGAKS